MGDQELRLKAKLDGGEETAQGLDKISGAEAKVADETKKGAGATAEATQAQDKLNAVESDYLGILNSISPALGQFVDAGIKASKVAGDLASQNINAVGIWNKATEAIKANAGALKLIGAGGAVVLGIWAIIRATEKMREEFEAATKAIEANRRALTELKGEERDRQQAIENIAERRPQGGFTADEARAAAKAASDIQGNEPWLQPEAVDRAAALYGQRSREDMAKAAYLMQSQKLQAEPTMTATELEARLNAALERNADAIARAFGRERRQEVELARTARQQQADRTLGGSYEAILEYAKRAAEGSGLDPDELARMAAAYRDAQQTGTMAVSDDMIRLRLGGAIGRQDEGLWGFDKRPLPATEQEYAIVQLINQMIEAALKRGERDEGEGEQTQALKEVAQAAREAAEAAREATRAAREAATEPRQVHNNHYQQHARFVQTDAESRKRATVNGENDRERRGVG